MREMKIWASGGALLLALAVLMGFGLADSLSSAGDAGNSEVEAVDVPAKALGPFSPSGEVRETNPHLADAGRQHSRILPAKDAVGSGSGPTDSALHDLLVPVEGVQPNDLYDSYQDPRSAGRSHQAIDILAPRGTPVLAAGDGTVAKLFDSKRGGLTIYVYDTSGRYVHYYAHLEAYAPGLRAGDLVARGQKIGRVGSTGNASPDAPHLHFAIHRLATGERWWQGTPINPFPLLVQPAAERSAS